MKKFLNLIYVFLFCCFPAAVYAEDVPAATVENTVQEEVQNAVQEEVQNDAIQVIEMEENKVILNIQKQPLNEKSKQKLLLKKNWFVVNVNINGKVKVQPISGTYEVE